jgi:hypothetical protein
VMRAGRGRWEIENETFNFEVLKSISLSDPVHQMKRILPPQGDCCAPARIFPK